MRLSIEEALARGHISREEAKAMRQAAKHSPLRGRAGRRRGDESRPQRLLFEALEAEWPGECFAELAVPGLHPSRPYRLDVAIPGDRIAIECDGWQYHGKFLADFKKDRVRQNILAVQGWMVMRFFPERIYGAIEGIVEEVRLARASRQGVAFDEDSLKRVREAYSR